MISWSPLKQGDLVDVVAPGSASQTKSIASALKVLKNWGLRVRMPSDSVRSYLYHAQKDEVRARLLIDALTAKDSQAVWCMRGGYGSNRLISDLMEVRKPKTAKLFVGLSDVTSLHIFLNTQWKWKTLHGPVLERLGRGDLSEVGKKEIHDLVFGLQDVVEFKKLKPMNAAARNTRSLRGELLGGNLMTLQSTIGTDLHLNLRGKVLFLEEVAERGYRVDRILYHLRDAGCLKGARAILLGEFIGGDEPGLKKKNYVRNALERFANDVNIPVYQGLPVGHGWDQRTLPLGAVAQIEKTILRVPAGAKL